MSDDEEVERLRRLRERQIKGRDPGKKDQKMHQDIGHKLQKSRRVSISQIIDEMPARWLYLYIGFILGVLVGLLLIAIFQNNIWAQAGAILIIFVFAFVGRVMGQAEDWRKKP